MSRFVRGNFVFMLQRQADIVKTEQQKLTAMLVEVKHDVQLGRR